MAAPATAGSAVAPRQKMMLRERVGEVDRLAAFSERDVSGNKPSTSRTRTRDVREGGTKAGHSAP